MVMSFLFRDLKRCRQTVGGIAEGRNTTFYSSGGNIDRSMIDFLSHLYRFKNISHIFWHDCYAHVDMQVADC
jgi:hypothetical protein